MTDNLSALTASNMKYLLVIYELEYHGYGVRCTDIAEILHVTKPSVHRITTARKEMRLIHKDRYGTVSLTESGTALSVRYLECYQVLYGYFKQLLPHKSNIRSVSCAVLAQLPLEAAERMCANMRNEQQQGAMEHESSTEPGLMEDGAPSPSQDCKYSGGGEST